MVCYEGFKPSKCLMKELVDKCCDGRPATRIEYEGVIESPLVEIDLLRRLQEKEVMRRRNTLKSMVGR